MEKTVLNKKKRWNDEARAGLVFALPPVIGFFMFTAIPVVFSIFASFTDWNSMTNLTDFSTLEFIGIENYKELFTDSQFWRALWNTFFYMIGIPLGILWALGLALSFNKDLPGIKTFRVIYYIPVVSSIVAVSLLWRWLYNGD